MQCYKAKTYLKVATKEKNVRKNYTELFPPAHLRVSQHKLASILGHSTITSKLGHRHADICGQGIGALEMRNIIMFNKFLGQNKKV